MIHLATRFSGPQHGYVTKEAFRLRLGRHSAARPAAAPQAHLDAGNAAHRPADGAQQRHAAPPLAEEAVVALVDGRLRRSAQLVRRQGHHYRQHQPRVAHLLAKFGRRVAHAHLQPPGRVPRQLTLQRRLAFLARLLQDGRLEGAAALEARLARPQVHVERILRLQLAAALRQPALQALRQVGSR